jgi:hypothetical protein
MKLTRNEREMIESYRKAGSANQDSIRWAAEVAARVTGKFNQKQSETREE